MILRVALLGVFAACLSGEQEPDLHNQPTDKKEKSRKIFIRFEYEKIILKALQEQQEKESTKPTRKDNNQKG